MTLKKKITVQYYALLREQRGTNEETLETTVSTAEQLYKDLQGQYNFTLPITLCKVAINDAFVDWSTDLQSGDTVVFVPPVSGG